MHRIMRSPEVERTTTICFPAGYNDEVRDLMIPSFPNWVKTAAARALLDASGFTRTALHRMRLTHGLDLDRMGNDLDYIAQWVQSSVWPGWHVCGTCRLGRIEDPLAVVDGMCRVRQI